MLINFTSGLIVLTTVTTNFLFGMSRKTNGVFIACMLLLLWVIYGGNDENPDYDGYRLRYELIERGDVLVEALALEPGYELMMRLAVSMGFGYQGFLMLVAALGLILINGAVRRIPGAAHFVYPLYFVYPFALDVIQVRNFLALALVVRGVSFLLSESRRPRVAFISCVAIAATIQVSSAIYAALIFVPLRRKIGSWPVFLSVFGTGIMLIAPGAAGYLAQLTGWLSASDKYDGYFETRGRAGFLIFALAQAWIYMLLNKSLAAAESVEASVKQAPMRLLYLARNTSLLLMVAVPIYVINSNFWRFSRNLHIVFYMGLFVGYSALSSKASKQTLFLIAVLLYCGLAFVAQLSPLSDDGLIWQVLPNNVIIRFLSSLGGG